MLVQRLALYSTLGWLMLALGQTWDTWGFWCVLALFWASEHLTRLEVITAIEQELRAQRKKQQEDHNNEQS